MNVDIMHKRCENLVIAMVGKEMAPKWWNGSNKAFDGKSPEEDFKENPEKVYSYLMKSADGEW
jgi:hypothetical protein